MKQEKFWQCQTTSPVCHTISLPNSMEANRFRLIRYSHKRYSLHKQSRTEQTAILYRYEIDNNHNAKFQIWNFYQLLKFRTKYLLCLTEHGHWLLHRFHIVRSYSFSDLLFQHHNIQLNKRNDGAKDSFEEISPQTSQKPLGLKGTSFPDTFCFTCHEFWKRTFTQLRSKRK